MAINFLPNPVYRFKDTNDAVLSGGLVFTYDTGTTNKQVVWKDKAKVAAHTNPIVLDSRGEAEIWFDGTLDLVTAPAGDTDPPTSPIETIVGVQSSIIPVSSSGTGVVVNPSFEADGTLLLDWVSAPAAGATITVDTVDSVDGSNVAKFLAAGSGGGSLTSSIIPVVEDSVLTLNALIRSANVSTTNTIQFIFHDQAQAVTSTVTVYNNAGTSDTAWERIYQAVVVPTGSVYIKVRLNGSTAGAGTTWFDRIFVKDNLDNFLAYVRVNKSATQTIAASTTTNLTWDSELSDEFNTHDNSVNNNRITIPPWCKLAKFNFNIAWNTNTTIASFRRVQLINSVSGTIFTSFNNHGATVFPNSNHFTTGWIAVVGGEFFTMDVRHTDSLSKDIFNAESYFEVEFRTS